jgi:hypothetical protein
MTLAALLPAAPAQAATYGPARAAYGGGTSQKHPMSITLTRRGRSVSRMFVRLDARCPSSNQIRWETIEIDATPLHRDGRFSDGGVVEGNTQVGDTFLNFRMKVKGRVGRRGARGTARLYGTVKDKAGKVIDSCDSGTVKWTLRRGRVYAGSTRDGTAVTLTTTRTRRTIKSFYIDVQVTCPGGIDIQSRRHAKVPVDGDGRFELADDAFTLKGRLKAGKASGTYRLSEGGCESGLVRWSARRG